MNRDMSLEPCCLCKCCGPIAWPWCSDPQRAELFIAVAGVVLPQLRDDHRDHGVVGARLLHAL